MLILERTIGVASMEVQGVGSLPSQIHFLLYIVTLLVRFFLIYVLLKAFSGRMLEHTPPSLESRAWVREILTHMLRFGFLGRGPGTSIKERIFFGLSECPMLFDFWVVIMDVDLCSYHFRSLKSGALVTLWIGRGIENVTAVFLKSLQTPCGGSSLWARSWQGELPRRHLMSLPMLIINNQ